jgi:hypothetical protein
MLQSEKRTLRILSSTCVLSRQLLGYPGVLKDGSPDSRQISAAPTYDMPAKRGNAPRAIRNGGE